MAHMYVRRLFCFVLWWCGPIAIKVFVRYARVAHEGRIKPELRKLEIQTAESIASVSAKIAEVEAMRAELDRRLGSSSDTIEVAQTELDEARRQTAEAGLAANTAHLAEIPRR